MEIDTPPKEIVDVPPEEPKKDAPHEAPREVQIVDGERAPSISGEAGRKDHNVFIGTLNVFNAPVQRYLGEPLKRRYHRHYHPRHKHGKKHLVADILLALAVVVLLGVNVYAFFFSTPGLQEKVVMTLGVTPETLRSGDPVMMTVDYDNRSDSTLRDAALSILCPCAVEPITVEPADIYDAKTHTFRIGTIEPHGNGSIRFAWLFVGTVGQTQHFSAALSYGTEGASRRETKSVVWRAPVADTVLDVTIDTPSEFVHESTVPFTIRYRNRGTRPLTHVRLEPVFSATMRPINVRPALVDSALTLPLLEPGREGVLSGHFAFTGRGATEAVVAVVTYLGDSRIVQQEVKRHATVFYPKLVVAPTPKEGADIVQLGSEVPLTFSYENGEDSDVVDFSLTVLPPSTLFLIDAKTPTTFSKVQDASLALLRSGVKGTIEFTLRTKPSVNRKELFGEGDPIVQIPYRVAYRLASRPQREIRIERTAPWRLASDFTLDAFARYFTPEGDQLGRGSLPPRVGETTKYWIFIPLVNSISDVSDALVTAQLGTGVEWTKKSSVTLGEPLVYDERTRTLTWRVPLVTQFSGGIYPDVGAAVEVAFTPSAAHVGLTPPLLQEIRARGRDTFTGTTLERTTEAVTTDLTVDQRAKGKGRVIP